jgi:hypothetical protein
MKTTKRDWTQEQRDSAVGTARAALKKGDSLGDALKGAGITTSNWYNWTRGSRSKRAKGSKGGSTKVVTYMAEPKTKSYKPRKQPKSPSDQLGLVLGSPAELAEFMRLMRGER